MRTLIGDYRDKLEKVLADFGPLVLEVHPFELLLGREVVYVEADRERSLAFRLFRDGVRRMAFQPGATWEELLRLLQILSIRYTGVRQQEDDLVTLLRKAAFEHLSIDAIEGFVPEEVSSERPLGDMLRGNRCAASRQPTGTCRCRPFRRPCPCATARCRRSCCSACARRSPTTPCPARRCTSSRRRCTPGARSTRSSCSASPSRCGSTCWSRDARTS